MAAGWNVGSSEQSKINGSASMTDGKSSYAGSVVVCIGPECAQPGQSPECALVWTVLSSVKNLLAYWFD